MTVHPGHHPTEVPAPAGYPRAAAVIMRSLVCLYLVVVKSAVAAVARPAAVGGIVVVLMSDGLVEALPEAELEVVLAHEAAHPTNGDGRVIGTALGPVPVATLKRPTRPASVQRPTSGSGQPPSLSPPAGGAGRLDRSVPHPPRTKERVEYLNSSTEPAETSR